LCHINILMRFSEYYKLIEESPDTFIYNIDGEVISIKWDDDFAKPFGFINSKLKFKINGKTLSYFKNVEIDNHLIVGDVATRHFDMLKDLIRSIKKGSIMVKRYRNYINLDLSNDKLKEEVIEDPSYNFIVKSHDVFSPCGRIWLYPDIKNYKHIIISFWDDIVPIKINHITEVLEYFNIPKQLYDNVIIEMPYHDNNILKFKDLVDNIKYGNIPKRRNFRSDNELSHLASGFGGAFKNKKGAGSFAQAKRAKRAGYDSVAKYKNDRFFSEQSDSIF
jgi:hypothetical protein